MRSAGRTAVVAICAAVAIATPIAWRVLSKQAAERKLAEQAKHYRELADKGDANAQYELGRAYASGRGLPQDWAQANLWCRKAADHGLAKASYALGSMYYYGDGVSQSYPDALVWFHKAADQGDARAQEALGGMYYDGHGVPQNYADALSWYRKASDQGFARAEYEVGYMYGHGQGVPKNREEAERWVRKAAAHGDRDAQQALGLRLAPLRPWAWVTQAVLAVACLYLISGFFPPTRILQGSDARMLAFAGTLSFLDIGMYLFEHSRYCLFPSAWAALVFRFATSFLGGVVVTLLATGVWRKAGKPLLILAGVLLALASVCLFSLAHFGTLSLTAFVSRFIVLASNPLGIALSAAVHLWRRKKEPEDSAAEPPTESGEPASTV